MKTPQVIKHLRAMHNPKEWAFFEELRIGGGFSKDSMQRFDAWAIHFQPNKRNVSRCYELKVSKADFQKEIKDPQKRRAGLRLSNEFYFVTPKGLCEISDIPPETGLLEVNSSGEIEKTIPAPFRDIEPPTWLFLSTICRRIDTDRKKEYDLLTEWEYLKKQYALVAQKVLEEHIERYANFTGGNKEVPDQIADALSKVYYEINDELKHSGKVSQATLLAAVLKD